MPVGAITRLARRKNTWFAKALFLVADRIMIGRANRHIQKIEPYLEGCKTVLDVGVGTGSVSRMLKQKGFEVKGVDVEDKSMYEDVKITIYDGENLPFKNKSIDVGVIIWVLHHCDDPRAVLSEAMRVCKRVVVIENVYDNWLEHRLTSLADQLGNGEFYEHNYLRVSEWRTFIDKRKWKLIEEQEWRTVSYGFAFSHDYLFVIE